MRDIKFRVWYKGDPFPMDKDDLEDYEKPQMIYDVQSLYDGRGFTVVLAGISCFGSLLDNEDFVVMQYTELKDKNGKEIYEGDIVVIDCGTYTDVDKIQYEYGAFRFTNGDVVSRGSGLEVIGNIHETPELLV